MRHEAPRFTGESRCPRQKWIPAFAEKARRGRELTYLNDSEHQHVVAGFLSVELFAEPLGVRNGQSSHSLPNSTNTPILHERYFGPP